MSHVMQHLKMISVDNDMERKFQKNVTPKWGGGITPKIVF